MSLNSKQLTVEILSRLWGRKKDMIKIVFKGDYDGLFWKQIDRRGENWSESAITMDVCEDDDSKWRRHIVCMCS